MAAPAPRARRYPAGADGASGAASAARNSESAARSSAGSVTGSRQLKSRQT
jgi:hypothetical protein